MAMQLIKKFKIIVKNLWYLLQPQMRYVKYSFSHCGEDAILYNIFTQLIGLNKIKYIDIGCNHPIKHNNSYLFYLLGSTGINIDANPIFEKDYTLYRKNDVFFNCGATTTYLTNQELCFYVYNNPHNELSTFDKETVDRLAKHKIYHCKTINVPLLKINEIIEKFLLRICFC